MRLLVPRVTIIPSVALVALLMVGPTLAPAQVDEDVRVLYPPAGAVVTSNPTLFLVIGPDAPEAPALQLDGASLPLDKMTFAEAWKEIPAKILMPAGGDDLPLRSPLLENKEGNVLWATAMDLADGEHVVTLDGAALASFRSRQAKETDPRTWDEPVLRVHATPDSPSEALDCRQCHRSESAKVLGVAPLPQSCHSCHDDVDLAVSHEHVMEFLEKCHMCHDPHAATRPALLIDRREVVCAQCHESGYSR